MPAVSGKSQFFAKHGNRLSQSVKAHRADPTEYGPMRLPPGISNGIAKLVECTFGTVASGKQNAGETYWRAAGVVIEPKTVIVDGQEIPIQGQQTSIMEMLCDTRTQAGKATSFDEHLANYLNELRKLGGEDFTAGAETEDDLKHLNEALKEAGPYFRFSTSAGQATKEFPNPRIWENWHGTKGLEEYEPPEDSGVDDQTGPADPRRYDAPPSDNGPPAADLEFGDLDSLAERAENKDKAAIAELKELAEKAGVDEGAVDEAEDWAAVAKLVKDAARGGEGPSTEPKPYVPKKKDVVLYRPLGKDKKPVKHAVECQVEAVDKKSETATLKNLEDRGTVYKNVAFSDLAEPD